MTALSDARIYTTTEAFCVGSVAPMAGTTKKLSVRLATALNAGESVTWTFRVNTTNSSLAVTLSGAGAQEGSATIDAAFIRGDKLKITRTASGIASVPDEYMELEVEWSDADAHGYGASTLASIDATTYYLAPTGYFYAASLPGTEMIMPFAGTITATNFAFPTNVPASADRTLTWMKDGVAQDGTGGTPDTRITVSTGANAGASDTSLSFVAGTRLAFRSTGTGAPTSERLGFGFKVVPTTAGESAIFGGTPGTLTSYPTYSDLDGRSSPALPTSDTLRTRFFAQGDTLEALYCYIYGVNAGNTFSLTVLNGGSATGLTVSIAGTASAGNVSSSVAPAAGDLLSLAIGRTEGTQTRSHQWGLKVVQDVGGSPPGPISDLAATVISSTQVDLTWTAATGATSHRVERATVA